ncbi:DUF4158 domain-containing protein, partial [Streptomyces sp. MCAF7]
MSWCFLQPGRGAAGLRGVPGADAYGPPSAGRGYLGWRSAKSLELKELDEFLLARAMEHDSPSLLFRLGCEYLRSAKVIRPGVVSLLERVATARQAAEVPGPAIWPWPTDSDRVTQSRCSP